MVTPAAAAASAMEAATRLQSFEGKAFFDDESGAQIERRGTAHGEIVNRAMDGQRTDIAAGEKQRLDHERIGGESEPRAADFENRLVVQAIEHRIGEQGQKHIAQQVRAELAAAAVAEHNLVADAPWARGKRTSGSLGCAIKSLQAWRLYWYQAAQAPSAETIGAPSGFIGVQRLPNAGQSIGFFRPCSTSALMHSVGSSTCRGSS